MDEKGAPADPPAAQEAFFSGPFEPEEVRRVLALIDERLRLRAALNVPAPATSAGPTATARPLPLAPTAEPGVFAAAEGLVGLKAPFFDPGRGGVAKRLLNLPLRVVGRPQSYFNEALRRILGSWSAVLRAAVDFQGVLRGELLAQRSELASQAAALAEVRDVLGRIPELAPRLEARLTSVEQWLGGLDRRMAGDEAWVKALSEEVPKLWETLHRVRIDALSALRFGPGGGSSREEGGRVPAVVDPAGYRELCATMPEGLRVNLGCGEALVAGYINVDARPLPGVDVVADVTDLPFAPGSVAELLSAHLVEHFHRYDLVHRILPYWRTLLRPGGRLRVVCPNWEAALEAHRLGKMTLERLHEITFGSQEYEGNDHLAMYTPLTLRATLEEAGFVDVAVLVQDRDNSGCPEMELAAYRARE